MKVSELIERLQECDPNSPVHFTYNYGDHGRTMVAPEVKSVEDSYQVVHSDYHDMDRLVDDEEDLRNKIAKEVVVLR